MKPKKYIAGVTISDEKGKHYVRGDVFEKAYEDPDVEEMLLERGVLITFEEWEKICRATLADLGEFKTPEYMLEFLQSLPAPKAPTPPPAKKSGGDEREIAGDDDDGRGACGF